MSSSTEFENYKTAAKYIKGFLKEPEIAVVLGSGLGSYADKVKDAVFLPYKDIPHFPVSTVQSHAGRLVAGTIEGKSVALLQGRFHFYEGYSLAVVTFYVRVLKLLGVKTLILTNAAGGVNESYNIGDLMIINDHIKFFGDSPMRGPNNSEFGDRFFDMTQAYSPRLRKIARDVADQNGITAHDGVYFFMPGPEFETPAEIRAIRMLGGDAVGMSTVFETITAAHCGLEIVGISCITNMAAGVIPGSVVSHEEVGVNAAEAALRFGYMIDGIIKNA